MAKSKKSGKRRGGSRRSSRRRSSRRATGFKIGGSRRGFLAASPTDLALGGAGALGAAFGVPFVLSKIPVAQLQSGWGRVLATAAISAIAGGLVAKFNKAAGLGMAFGGIGSAGLQAIAQSRGGVSGYDYQLGEANWPTFAPSVEGYMTEPSLSGYVNV